jgi:acyl dehydratase
MSLDDYLQVGRRVYLGSHTFTPAAIMAFAAKYDPQPFHIDEAQALGTVFGRLCASGWHTAAVWMRLNVDAGMTAEPATWTGEGKPPEIGPSPGITNLKWLKPVYAGETVHFSRIATGHRKLSSRPPWFELSLRAEGSDSQGDKVIEFESSVLVQSESSVNPNSEDT